MTMQKELHNPAFMGGMKNNNLIIYGGGVAMGV